MPAVVLEILKKLDDVDVALPLPGPSFSSPFKSDFFLNPRYPNNRVLELGAKIPLPRDFCLLWISSD